MGYDVTSRLQTLLGYLEADPENLTLMADAANTAFNEGDMDQAAILLNRYGYYAPLPPGLINTSGLLALRQQRLVDAAAAFDALLIQGVTEPSVRFNRAWVHALEGEYESVLGLLDDDVVSHVAAASSLRVQALHHLGRVEEALAVGQGMVERLAHNDALLGALSVVAMDANDLALARYYAETAVGSVDAITTTGLLALNDGDAEAAIRLFDAALSERADAPRALLGKGLGLLSLGHAIEAAATLEQGAALFGAHLGSWIAVGWARLLAGQPDAARTAFERTRALDESFAESYGGLAVLDLMAGNEVGGRRNGEIALRLDRQSFGGMLARLMMEQSKGDSAAAQRIWDHAMDSAVGPGGRTLGQMLVGLGIAPTRSAAHRSWCNRCRATGPIR